MQMFPKFIVKNTIAHIHVALEHNQPTPFMGLFRVLHIQIWRYFFVIFQVQVIKTTQYMTSNFMCSRPKV